MSLADIWNNVYNALVNNVTPALQNIAAQIIPLQNISRDVFGWLTSGFSEMGWAGVVNIDKVFHAIQDYLVPTLAQIPATIQNVFGWLTSGFSEMGWSIAVNIDKVFHAIQDSLIPAIREVPQTLSAIASVVPNIAAALSNSVLNAGNIISNAIQGAFNILPPLFTQLGNVIVNAIQGGFNILPPLFSQIADAIAQGMAGLYDIIIQIPQQLRTLTQIFSSFLDLGEKFGAFLEWLVDLNKNVIRNPLYELLLEKLHKYPSIGEFLVHVKEQVYGLALSAVLAIINQMFINPLMGILRAIRGESSGIRWVDTYVKNVTLSVSNEIIHTIRHLLEEETYPQGEKAWEIASRFVAYCYMFSIIGAIAQFIDRIIWSVLRFHVLGTGLGSSDGGGGGELHTLVMGLYYSTGLGWLSWAAFGPLVRYTIADPLREYFAYKYRPERFTRSEAQRLLRKGIITEEEFRDELAWLGYNDDKITKFLEDAKEDLSFSQIAELYEEGMITLDEVEKYLRRLGFRGTELLLAREIIRLRATRDERSKLISRICKWYARGYLDYDTAFRYITSLGVPRDQATILLAAYELDFQLEVTEEIIDTYIDAFRKDLITEDEFRDYLAQYIRRPELLEAIIERELVRKAPKITPLTFYRLERQLRYLQRRYDNVVAEINYYKERLEQEKLACEQRRKVLIAQYDKRLLSLREWYEKERERLDKQYKIKIDILRFVLENLVDKPAEELSAFAEDLQRRASIAPREIAEVYKYLIRVIYNIIELPPERRKEILEQELKIAEEKYQEELQLLESKYREREQVIIKERDERLKKIDADCEKRISALVNRIQRLESLKESLEVEIESYKRALEEYLARRRL